ncbi:preprotein translocase subunit YajC [Actinomadura sp. 9N407]|uniref:preprotein translocase subunit YajC n=1 Tax=Actinomadura sp. 9N407 TaxID=3375154 RepID=UPI0037BD3F4B
MIIAAEQGGSGAFNLLLLLAVPLVFYFLLIRPQSKRRKQQMEMQSNLQPGAKVVTTSGMHASVVSVDDDGIVLEISPGVEARFVKAAVMNVVKSTGEDVDLTEDEDEDDEDEDLTEDDEAKTDLSKSGAKADLGKSDAKATDEDGETGEDAESAGATAVGKGSKKSSG